MYKEQLNMHMIDMKWLLTCIYLLGFILLLPRHLTLAQNMSDEIRLYKHLLSDYQEDIRPYTNRSQPTTLTVAVVMFRIVEVNLPEGVFSGTFSIRAMWHDPRMTWNPSDYGDISEILIPRKRVWYPQIVMGSVVETVAVFGSDVERVTYQNNGMAALSLSDLGKVTCDYNERKYPFDIHTCEILLLLFGYGPKDVEFQAGSTDILSDLYTKHPEWDITKTNMQKVVLSGYGSVIMSITIKRRELHFIIVRLLPISTLALLNVFVFKLPIESGERIGYSITCLLSLVVFLSEITNDLPTGSLNISYTSLCLSLLTLVSSLVCLVVVVTQQFHFQPENKAVPKKLRTLTSFIAILCCRCCNRKQKRAASAVNVVHPSSNVNEGEMDGKNFTDTEKEMDWKQIATVFDSFFFYFCLTCLIVIMGLNTLLALL